MIVALVALLLSIAPQPFLRAGDKAIRSGNWKEASISFKAAINTGRLNKGGMSIAYWNIHIAEYNLKHIDLDMDAVLGFIVYGSEFAESTQSLFKQWGKKFKLKRKLNYAIALIQATWASRNNHSCRSEIFSCYIASKSLIRIFELIIPFCVDRKVNNILIKNKGQTLRANITCSSGVESEIYYENYYFTVKNEH